LRLSRSLRWVETMLYSLEVLQSRAMTSRAICVMSPVGHKIYSWLAP